MSVLSGALMLVLWAMREVVRKVRAMAKVDRRNILAGDGFFLRLGVGDCVGI